MRKLVVGTLIFLLLLAVTIAQTSAQTDSTLGYQLVWQVEDDHRISLVEWRPQSDVLAVATENYVILLNAQTGEEIRRIEIDDANYVSDMAWNRDGSLFAAGDTDQWVHIYGEQWQETTTFFALWLWALEWHPFRDELLTVNDSETSPSAYSDMRVTVWSLEGEVKRTLRALRGVSDIEFSPDGQYLAGIRWNIQGVVWNAESYGVDHHISLIPSPGNLSDSHPAQSIAWNPNSQRIAVLSNNNRSAIFSFVVWDVAARQMVRKVEAAEAFLYSLSWHPRLDFLASGSGDGAVRIWDMQTYENVLTITEENSLITSVAWSPDGKFLAVAGRGGTVKLWQIDLPDDQ